MSAAALEISGLIAGFRGVPVLRGIDLAPPPGRMTALLGPSGSGKTTLLRVLAGFVPAEAGAVTVDGEDLLALPVHRRRIGMMFQSYALFPHLTVAGNIGFGLEMAGLPRLERERRIAEALDLVQLQGLERRWPKALSGGQQQRVALARAIVTGPRLLLLDEPLAALDRRLRQDLQGELRRIQRQTGLTTLIVTHDQEEALSLADHIAILEGGRLVQQGRPEALYQRPATRFVADFLGDAVLIEGVRQEGRLWPALGGPPLPLEAPGVEGPGLGLLRPEQIRLGAAEDVGGHVGRVLERRFIGAAARLRVMVPCLGEMLVLLPDPDLVALPEEGAAVTVTWQREALVWLPDGKED